MRLMEVEERLGLEQKQCQTVISTRVASLEERYAKLKHQYNDQSDKLKQYQLQKDNLEKESKHNQIKIKDLTFQISKLNDERQKLKQETKVNEDEIKRISVKHEDEIKKVLSKQEDEIRKIHVKYEHQLQDDKKKS